MSIKGIPFNFIKVSPIEGDCEKEEYLVKFPCGLAPGYEEPDTGLRLSESNAILHHFVNGIASCSFPNRPPLLIQLYYLYDLNARLHHCNLLQQFIAAMAPYRSHSNCGRFPPGPLLQEEFRGLTRIEIGM